MYCSASETGMEHLRCQLSFLTFCFLSDCICPFLFFHQSFYVAIHPLVYYQTYEQDNFKMNDRFCCKLAQMV